MAHLTIYLLFWLQSNFPHGQKEGKVKKYRAVKHKTIFSVRKTRLSGDLFARSAKKFAQ